MACPILPGSKWSRAAMGALFHCCSWLPRMIAERRSKAREYDYLRDLDARMMKDLGICPADIWLLERGGRLQARDHLEANPSQWEPGRDRLEGERG